MERPQPTEQGCPWGSHGSQQPQRAEAASCLAAGEGPGFSLQPAQQEHGWGLSTAEQELPWHYFWAGTYHTMRRTAPTNLAAHGAAEGSPLGTAAGCNPLLLALFCIALCNAVS